MFMLVSCNKDVVSPTNMANRQKAHEIVNANVVQFSGEELFRGIFLMQGEVALRLPAINATLESYGIAHASIDQTEDSRHFADEIVHGVAEQSPDYFQRLQKSVSSGDFYAVQAALREGHVLMTRAGEASPTYGSYFTRSVEAAKQVDLSKYDTSTPQGRHDLVAAVRAAAATVDPITKDDAARGNWFKVDTWLFCWGFVAIGIIFVIVLCARDSQGEIYGDGLENEEFVGQVINLMR